MPAKSTLRKLGVASMFLGPNLLGFLVFTLGPLIMSMILAFTDWDLRRHNRFHPNENLSFVGVANFTRLFAEPEFWRFFGNTLILMLGIPFSVAGSLGVAMLLNRDLGVGRKTVGMVIALALAIIATGSLAVLEGMSGMVLLIGGLFAVSLILGVLLGGTVYRTLLYLPSFTSGVATILLWKNLYNPHTGPINLALTPVLDGVAKTTVALPTWLLQSAMFVAAAIGLVVLSRWVRRLQQMWKDGELGTVAHVVGVGVALLPFVLLAAWSPSAVFGWATLGVAVAIALIASAPMFNGRAFTCPAGYGGGGVALIGFVLGTVQLGVLLLGVLLWQLPAWAQNGLAAPGWHTDYYWAKPAIILIGLWASLGSNNMLLYLAGLTGVPVELYEAADIDGVSPTQKFWHITWPQLAPTTFFIVIMSIIGGLQGGFEIARTLTKGGPDGSTTTLSYFIYNEGFVTGRLGYSSAIAWVLFAIVFAVTAFNWKFGNRYVND